MSAAAWGTGPSIPICEVLLWMVEQIGAEYVFGAETSRPVKDHVQALDCSEYVEAGCARAGVVPTMPDGSWLQWAHCQRFGTVLSVDVALQRKGALLFQGPPVPGPAGRVHHVALSLGDGRRTLEARGSAWRVGIFSQAWARPWSCAGSIPGTH